MMAGQGAGRVDDAASPGAAGRGVAAAGAARVGALSRRLLRDAAVCRGGSCCFVPCSTVNDWRCGGGDGLDCFAALAMTGLVLSDEVFFLLFLQKKKGFLAFLPSGAKDARVLVLSRAPVFSGRPVRCVRPKQEGFR